MNIQRLKNGKYRVREMFNGRTYSKNFPYKPTKKEAKLSIDELISKDNFIYKDEKLSECINAYINAKMNVLSPESIRHYVQYAKILPNKYGKLYLSELNSMVMQNLVNDYVKNHSPKTVRNYYGFIASVANMYLDKRFRVVFPPKIKIERYIPTREEVMAILKEAKGTQYFTPIFLASYGLRFGEIAALTVDDIEDCMITVNKAMVHGLNNKPVIKTPKTYASNRVVPVPKLITDKIKRDGIIYNGTNSALNDFIHRTCKKLNIEDFSVHKLRHFLATTLHYLNKPKRFIESFGGWENNSEVLEKIYVHTKDNTEIIDFYNLDKEFFK